MHIILNLKLLCVHACHWNHTAGEAEQGGQEGRLPSQLSQSLHRIIIFSIQIYSHSIFRPLKFWLIVSSAPAQQLPKMFNLQCAYRILSLFKATWVR